MRASLTALALALSALSFAATWSQEPDVDVPWLELEEATALARDTERPLLIVFR